MKTTNNYPCLLIILALFGAGLLPVHAHAFLTKSEPAVGAHLNKAPTQVKIWYTEGLEPAFSAIQVANADGARVDKNDSKVDGQDKSILTVTLAALSPGTYKVTWKVVAEDTHHTQGSFTFVIKP